MFKAGNEAKRVAAEERLDAALREAAVALRGYEAARPVGAHHTSPIWEGVFDPKEAADLYDAMVSARLALGIAKQERAREARRAARVLAS